MLEMRSLKFTIAAANPILAEKLATPTEQNVQNNGSSNSPQLAPLTPKVEKGRSSYFISPCKILYKEYCSLNKKIFFDKFIY